MSLRLLVAWIVVALPALAAAAPRTGFDHLLHGRDVLTATGAALPCARCHRMARGELVGRPGHAACYGACHGAPPTRAEARALAAVRPDAPESPPGAARRATCLACHADTELASLRSAPAYPPYTLDPDWGLTMSHARHAQAACLRCHSAPRDAAAPAAPRSPPHRRCAACHDGRTAGAAAMDACETCHFAAVGAGHAPAIERSRIVVTGAFSHQRHQPHVAKLPAASDCAPCHRDVAAGREPGAVPAPTAETCATAGCHDGAAAFGITERCTQCHRRAPDGPFAVPRPSQRYDHAGHADAQAALGCAGCHRIRPNTDGELDEPGHAACASCHAQDFGSPAPTICGACHTATEPWRPLRADRLPALDTAFGARLDHARHRLPCARCHSLDTASRQLRPPRGHVGCAGADCHRASGGAPPSLDACQACHQPALVRERRLARVRAPWSVRTRFDHASHRLGLDGQPAACSSCHLDVTGALAALPTPPKSTCAPCHDGARAFGLTGTACGRCHGRAR